MHLYLIRHLPTKWNLDGKLQGKRNIPLAEEILEQYKNKILTNKKVLKALEPIDVILASSLIRTQQTASVYGFNPKIEPLLDELDFGPYEGKSKSLLIKDHKEQWYEDPLNLVLGESIISLQERVQCFIEKYKKYNKVLVFGHGSWIRALISINSTGEIQSMNQFILENNVLTQVKIEGKDCC
jgi:broad specificity phosphatase PhoE